MEDEQDGQIAVQDSTATQHSITTQNDEEEDENFMQLMDQIGAKNAFDELSHLSYINRAHL